MFEVGLLHTGWMLNKQSSYQLSHIPLRLLQFPDIVTGLPGKYPIILLKFYNECDIISHMSKIDEFDLKILRELQRDAGLTADELAHRVALSRNACWRRVRRLEDEGFIRARVALVDADKLDLGLSVLIMIRTATHDPDWLQRFRSAVTSIPEITSAWRMSGDLDYVLRARVADMKAYDRLYQRLIEKLPLADVSASFVMEEIRETTELPV